MAPATWTLIALLILAGVVLLVVGQHLTFFYDEWAFILARRGSSLGSYLDPHGGHLVVFPVLVYKLLFALVGLRHYTPYRAVGISLHLACAALLYLLLRRPLGPWLALVPTTLLLFMGTASQDLLWPFQIGYLTSVAGGLAALILLGRRDRRGDAWATVALVWSISGSGVGLAMLAAAAVLLVTHGSPWRRGWVIAVPAVLFAIWYLGWGSSEPVTWDSFLASPQYVANAGAGALAGMAGLSLSWGAPLAAGALVLVVGGARRQGFVPPLGLAAAAGALTFWGLAAVVRSTGPDPAASRYLYVGAVFIWLLLAETGLRTDFTRGLLGLTLLLAAGALIANINALRDGVNGLREHDDAVRAALAAVDVARPVVSPAFLPDRLDAPVVTTGPYFAAARDLGSPALTQSELARASERTREGADEVLTHAESLTPSPYRGASTGSVPLDVEVAAGARMLPHGNCRSFVPVGGTGAVAVSIRPPAALVLQTASGAQNSLFLRRFASSFPASPQLTIPAGGTSVLRFPVDLAPHRPWHVQLVGSRPTQLCLR